MKAFFIIITILSFSATLKAAPKTLTVYTSRKQHLVIDLFKKYESETGTIIKFKTGNAGGLVQNLIAEKKNPQADLFMTVDAGNLWFASTQGVLEKTSSSALEKLVPKHLRDPNGYWFALSKRVRTTVINSKAQKNLKKISYESLADKRWNKKLCLRTSKKVYNQSLGAMLIAMNGKEKAKLILEGWVKNKVEVFANDTAVLKAVAQGLCDIGIVNSYYFGRLIKKQPKLPLKILWPNQESYGAHINISGIGVVKNARHKEEALKFIEWLLTPPAQKIIAEQNMEYPIAANVKASPLVQSWGPFKENTEFPLVKAGKLQMQAIRLFSEVGYK